jgi:glutaredoxin
MLKIVAHAALVVLGGLAVLPADVVAQSVYRMVGPDGRVTFSDKPAPQSTSKPMDLRSGSSAPDNANLPYELRQAVSQFPVALYSTRNCGLCDAGRRLLQGRGVPFTEKTVSTAQDLEALQKLGGGNSLPFLTIGQQHIQGYSEFEWQQYLSAAGYPEQSKLPANYRRVAASPLVEPIQPAEKKPQETPTPEPENKPAELPAAIANPAGIQF